MKPDEVYNLAAQSHVHVSFDEPEYTANSDALGTLRLLEILRSRNYGEAVRFYQASTSELYGKVQQVPQKRGYCVLSSKPLCSGENVRLLITVNYEKLTVCSPVMAFFSIMSHPFVVKNSSHGK